MANSKEFRPGTPPAELKEKPSTADFKEEIDGLKEAIEATRKRIMDYESSGANVSDLKFHLSNLEQRLGFAQKNIK